jgi:hypothetical protein
VELGQRFGIGSRLGIVLNHSVNRVIECHQQRHVAGADLRQHAHGDTDLRFTVFVGEETGAKLKRMPTALAVTLRLTGRLARHISA